MQFNSSTRVFTREYISFYNFLKLDKMTLNIRKKYFLNAWFAFFPAVNIKSQTSMMYWGNTNLMLGERNLVWDATQRLHDLERSFILWNWASISLGYCEISRPN